MNFLYANLSEGKLKDILSDKTSKEETSGKIDLSIKSFILIVNDVKENNYSEILKNASPWNVFSLM